MRKKGYVLKQVQDASGMSYSGFYQCLRDDSFRFSVLLKIANFLEISIAEFDQDHHEKFGNVYLFRTDKLNNLKGKDLIVWQAEAKAHCELMLKSLQARDESQNWETMLNILNGPPK